MKKNVVKDLFSFIESSPTAFHTVDTIKKTLEENGFRELSRADDWKNIGKGIAGKGAGKATGKTPGKGVAPGKYYTTRNNTSIIAFKIGKDVADSYGFMISASHSDSPTFKIKENAEISVRGQYTKLNTEGYGGMICSTWFDRPLSFAGRVVVKENDTFVTKLFDPDRDLLMIPNLAIHMNRDVNDGYKYNKQVDLLPLFAGGTDGAAAADKVAGADGAAGADEVSLKNFVSRELKVSPDSIMGMDLYLYNRMKPVAWGLNEEFISAPRLDDLECAFTSLEGFLAGENSKMVQVYACFDNEEVGSGTKQGAASTFLFDVLSRINRNLGKSEDDYERALSSSFMLSCDNAHAVHPNHPEKTDDTNCAYLNSGIVIKSHAGQKYTSDAVSVALFRDICQRAGKTGKAEKAGKTGKAGKFGGNGVPCQFFANRSDAAGGSTLGNIAMTQVSINCVDIGLPQLAMHSAYETAGALDVGYMVDALTEFYNSYIEVNGDSEIKCGK